MPIIRHQDPFREMQEFMDRFWSGDLTQRGQTSLDTPVADVYTEGDGDKQNLVVEAHLPGFDQDDVEVNVEKGTLEVRAERSEKDEKDEDRKYVIRESSSSFYRRIGLPKNVKTDDVKAKFGEGVLKVTVPFEEVPEPKQVKIEGKK